MTKSWKLPRLAYPTRGSGERRENGEDNNIAPAKLTNDAEIESLLPIERWL